MSMTIQQAMKKAMKAGWDDGSHAMAGDEVTTYFVKTGSWYYQQDFLLDHLFWKHLGKAMGWDGYENVSIYGVNGKKVQVKKAVWLCNWHRFLDHLAEGKDAESFFETL